MTTMILSAACAILACAAVSAIGQTWTADNGNGTYTNPLFYDEFSDPDLIRVGEDFYLTGTTMHAMPGLPVLHSRDLVNWTFLTYASDKLDFGPNYRLDGDASIYGQGIWAPSFRYHDGTFYIFTNVNGRKTQLYRATDPAGPWTRTELKQSLHDLSVLFDDDGKTYVIWGYQEIHQAQLTDDLTDIVPGTERVIIPKGAGIGEGCHFYKINGAYYIFSAWFDGRMRMPCARATRPEGPYEVNQAISTDEDFGLAEGYRLRGGGPPFNVVEPNVRDGGRMSIHQGGIVDTPDGKEWWGFSMMDANSVGRLTTLSPITWQDGWPYFGLPGNLKRTPRTWTKPNVGPDGAASRIAVPYERDDDFAGPKLKPIWQWNHVPVDAKWSLAERPGFLRIHSSPAADLFHARNTLTQRAIGPESVPTVELDASGLKSGDVAGLALLNFPFGWIGVSSADGGLTVQQFDQRTGTSAKATVQGTHVWLRAQCDFLTEKATFFYSVDGKRFAPLGEPFTMIFQLRTFQGVRYGLFNYNTTGVDGGHADFDSFAVGEAHPHGLMRPIPTGALITLTTFGAAHQLVIDNGVLAGAASDLAKDRAATFDVEDQGLGRVALRSGLGYVSVDPDSSVSLRHRPLTDAERFQWIENVYGDLILMSLTTHRYLRVDPASGTLRADHVGPAPSRSDGSCFTWAAVERTRGR